MNGMAGIADLVDDPSWKCAFTVTRVTASISSTGMSAGELVATHPAPIPFTGTIYPNSDPDDLLVLPEGLRSNRAIHVLTQSRLYLGGTEESSGDITDYVNYLGSIWKVAHLTNWGEYGFYHALAVESPRAKLGTQV